MSASEPEPRDPYYWGKVSDPFVTDNRLGPNFARPLVHRTCSAENARLTALLAERDAEIVRLVDAGQAYIDACDAAVARAERAEATAAWAERKMIRELPGHGSNLLWVCWVCDQVGEREQIPHATDCPFAVLADARAALAAASEGE